jgi:hypothetical protein
LTSYFTVVIACNPVVVAIAQCLGRGEVYFLDLSGFYVVCMGLRTNSDGMYALTELAVVMET